MENRISIHYFTKKSNVNSKGNVAIYIRITLNSKRKEFAKNMFFVPNKEKIRLSSVTKKTHHFT